MVRLVAMIGAVRAVTAAAPQADREFVPLRAVPHTTALAAPDTVVASQPARDIRGIGSQEGRLSRARLNALDDTQPVEPVEAVLDDFLRCCLAS